MAGVRNRRLGAGVPRHKRARSVHRRLYVVRAADAWALPEPARSEPLGAVRHPAAHRRPAEADYERGYHAGGSRPLGHDARADCLGRPDAARCGGVPVRAGQLSGKAEHWNPVRFGRHFGEHGRHIHGGVGFGEQVRDAGRDARRGDARELRSADGAGRRGRSDTLRVAGAVRHCGGAERPVPAGSAARLPHIRGGGVGGDEPNAVRPDRSGVRAGIGLQHGVQRHQVRAAVSGGVHGAAYQLHDNRDTLSRRDERLFARSGSDMVHPEDFCGSIRAAVGARHLA